MTDRLSDIQEIRDLCKQRHPHSPDEDIAWLAVHRLLREIDWLIKTDLDHARKHHRANT